VYELDLFEVDLKNKHKEDQRYNPQEDPEYVTRERTFVELQIKKFNEALSKWDLATSE